MSLPQKRKYTKRNFDQEADLQIKILEQKAREDFLVDFSQNDVSTVKITEPPHTLISNKKPSNQNRDENETKVYIPAKAKMVLEKWMYEHRLYCYPTKTEKQALALETGLSVQKISNWFINSRRRMLPKMLQTEGRNPINFTISRKKKKNAMAINKTTNNCPADTLTTYAIAEETKIIDQNSIFFGHDFEFDTQQNSDAVERTLQEIIVPYTESEEENSQTTIGRPENTEQPFDRITRGILYDQPTQSKCFFIVINSAK